MEGLLSQLGPGFTFHQGQENRGVLSWSCGLHVAWLKVLPGWCILVEASYFRSGMKLRSSIAGRGHQSSLTADESEKARITTGGWQATLLWLFLASPGRMAPSLRLSFGGVLEGWSYPRGHGSGGFSGPCWSPRSNVDP